MSRCSRPERLRAARRASGKAGGSVAGGRSRDRYDPARAEAAFDAIAATGRDALRQLRRTLGILRAGGDGADLAPQPGLDDLPALPVDVARRIWPVWLDTSRRGGSA